MSFGADAAACDRAHGPLEGGGPLPGVAWSMHAEARRVPSPGACHGRLRSRLPGRNTWVEVVVLVQHLPDVLPGRRVGPPWTTRLNP